MDNKRFSKEYEIHYYETNSFQEATPITLLNFLEDSAISNSASVGCRQSLWTSEHVGFCTAGLSELQISCWGKDFSTNMAIIL